MKLKNSSSGLSLSTGTYDDYNGEQSAYYCPTPELFHIAFLEVQGNINKKTSKLLLNINNKHIIKANVSSTHQKLLSANLLQKQERRKELTLKQNTGYSHKQKLTSQTFLK